MSLPARRCLILLQPEADHWQQIEAWFLQQPEQRRLWLSANDHAYGRAQQRAQDYLGRELDILVFDGTQQLRADSLAAILGCLCAGGVLLLVLPAEHSVSRWQQRLLHIARQFAADSDAIQFWQTLPALPQIETSSQIRPTAATADQQQAINAIEKVLTGHRRRPLLLVADRGRGKSAALGMAAATLLQQGRQHIGISAPSRASVDSVFEHALRLLPEASLQTDGLSWQGRQLQFIAPDRLLAETPTLDLLLVDEAAAIPLPMLTEMLQRYARLVFSTTLHGYEGSGRGFATRFKAVLDQQTPGWQQYTLQTPIRWSANDPVEAFSFRALLLDAEAAELSAKQLPELSQAQFVELSANDLLADDRSCRQLTALLTLAHYRTRPSDLQMLLDQPGLRLFVLQAQQQILACLWLVAEGPLDQTVAEAVYAGERRLKGELLPQTLLAHAGLPTAGQYHYQRIVRIAVHPELQGQGWGSQLLQQVESQLDSDLLGTSFALTEPLLRFWSGNGYQPVRLGLSVDHVSGSQAMIMLKAVTPQGQNLVDQARQRLNQHWPALLSQSLRQLPVAEVLQISRCLSPELPPLSSLDAAEVNAFALRQRGFSFSQLSLQHWIWNRLDDQRFATLSSVQQTLLIRLLLQHWSLTEVASALSLAGKNAVVTECREAVRLLL